MILQLNQLLSYVQDLIAVFDILKYLSGDLVFLEAEMISIHVHCYFIFSPEDFEWLMRAPRVRNNSEGILLCDNQNLKSLFWLIPSTGTKSYLRCKHHKMIIHTICILGIPFSTKCSCFTILKTVSLLGIIVIDFYVKFHFCNHNNYFALSDHTSVMAATTPTQLLGNSWNYSLYKKKRVQSEKILSR